MKTIEEKAKEIFGARAATYTASAPHVDRDALAKVIEAAQPQPTWAALDIATGTGNTAFALALHVANVIGLDLTPEMLAQAGVDQLPQQPVRDVTSIVRIVGRSHAGCIVFLRSCQCATHSTVPTATHSDTGRTTPGQAPSMRYGTWWGGCCRSGTVWSGPCQLSGDRGGSDSWRRYAASRWQRDHAQPRMGTVT